MKVAKLKDKDKKVITTALLNNSLFKYCSVVKLKNFLFFFLSCISDLVISSVAVSKLNHLASIFLGNRFPFGLEKNI